MNKKELDQANANKIISIVSEYFNAESKTKCRKLGVMLPRQIAQYFIRKNLNLPYQKIADLYNMKSHATILSNFKKIEFNALHDSEVSFYVNDITIIIRQDKDLQRYRNPLEKIKEMTLINDILDIKTLFELRDIKALLLGQITKI